MNERDQMFLYRGVELGMLAGAFVTFVSILGGFLVAGLLR